MKKFSHVGRFAGTRTLLEVLRTRKAVVCNGVLVSDKSLKEEWELLRVSEKGDRCKTLDPRDPIGSTEYGSPFVEWSHGSYRSFYFRDFVGSQTGLYLYDDVLYDSSRTVVHGGSIIAVPVNTQYPSLTLDLNTVITRIGTSVAVKRIGVGYRNN